MRLREKGKKDGEVVTMGWDEAQAALQAGTHVVAEGSDASDGKDGQPSGADSQGGSKPADDGLDAKSEAELKALAAKRGVDISAAKTKADILAALRASK
ncbi:hypothetical protein [Methylobacterium sp. ID0610]|uniref:hypothetical protein n=1 Tax=Methylobacterium carpenticola TaxID=3344827 RepID=UPI0036AF1125